jgi:hypothetical protein
MGMAGNRERLHTSDPQTPTPWDKYSRGQNVIYLLKMTAMAVALLAGFLWTANFLMDVESDVHYKDYSVKQALKSQIKRRM